MLSHQVGLARAVNWLTLRRFKLGATSIMALAPLAGAALMPATAQGIIFVTSASDGTISAYTNSGVMVNAPLVSGLPDPGAIAVSGSNLFVVNDFPGTIGEYTTSGATVNASLVSGLANPIGIAVSGSDVYVANSLSGTNTLSGTVGEYTVSGGMVTASNPSLVTGLAPGSNGLTGIAVSGSNIFITDRYHGTIGEYTTSGATVNADLVSGLNQPYLLAVSGSDLFVVNNSSATIGIGTVGEYTISNGMVTVSNPSLISGLVNPTGIAILGSDLFVTDGQSGTGTIGEYTTSGAPVNATLVSGLNAPFDIAVTPDVPEPGSLCFLTLGSAALTFRRRSGTARAQA